MRSPPANAIGDPPISHAGPMGFIGSTGLTGAGVVVGWAEAGEALRSARSGVGDGGFGVARAGCGWVDGGVRGDDVPVAVGGDDCQVVKPCQVVMASSRWCRTAAMSSASSSGRAAMTWGRTCSGAMPWASARRRAARAGQDSLEDGPAGHDPVVVVVAFGLGGLIGGGVAGVGHPASGHGDVEGLPRHRRAHDGVDGGALGAVDGAGVAEIDIRPHHARRAALRPLAAPLRD